MVTTAQTQTTNITGLRYLFSHESGRVAAHCLELDLVASGATINEAEKRLNSVVLAQFAICYPSGNWSQLVNASAPKEYWEKLEKAHFWGHSKLNIEVPPAVLVVEKRVAALPVLMYEIQNGTVAA